MADELVGRTIAGRYRVTGPIGQGATAAVYRAEQDAEPREVALKALHSHLTGDSTFLGRFRREANLAARLSHANIVQLVDFGQDGQVFFIAMELLKGKELGQILRVERRISEKRAATILIGVLDALAVAHDLGAVHRDLKPDNIILEPGPQGEMVKVLDFGIAKIVQAEQTMGEEGLTKVGVAVGSPAYMSPEQCRGEQTVGPRSDLYACGVLGFEMVSGRAPFVGDSPVDIAMGHIRQAPPALSELVANPNPRFEAFVHKLLEKKADDRYQSAAEAKAALQAILGELSTSPLQPAGAGGTGTAPLQPSPFQPGPGPMPGGPMPMGGPQPPMQPGHPGPQGMQPHGMQPGPQGMQPGPQGMPQQQAMQPMQPAAMQAPTQPQPSGGSNLIWLLVPLAAVLGIGIGFAAFIFTSK